MKIAIVLFIFALVIVGCTSGQGPVQIQVDPASQEVIAKIAARHLGAELQNRYPDVAKKVLSLSKSILILSESILTIEGKELIVILTDKLISVLLVETTDPLLAMDIKDLTDLIEVNVAIDITEDQMKIIKAVAGGLVSGIEI